MTKINLGATFGSESGGMTAAVTAPSLPYMTMTGLQLLGQSCIL